MPLLKSAEEIKQIHAGGKILAEIMRELRARARVGATTADINGLAEELIAKAGGAPSFKGYGEQTPFPAALCTSVNEQLVHAIPSGYVLKSGDLLSVDIGMRYPGKNGLFTDMAITMPIGRVSAEAKRLIKVTQKALAIWIKRVKPNADLNQIARQVQNYIEGENFSVVRDLVGHGVGHAVHEEPAIANYYIEGSSFILKQGMVLAFEPMVSAGDWRIKTQEDGWAVVMLDGSLCAHFEHTVVVTNGGCEVATA